MPCQGQWKEGIDPLSQDPSLRRTRFTHDKESRLLFQLGIFKINRKFQCKNYEWMQSCESRRQKNSTITRPSFSSSRKPSTISRPSLYSPRKGSPMPMPRPSSPRKPSQMTSARSLDTGSIGGGGGGLWRQREQFKWVH